MFGEGLSVDELWDKQLFVFFSIVQKLGEWKHALCRPHCTHQQLLLYVAPPSPRPIFIAALGYYIFMLDAVTLMGEMRWYQRGPWVQRYARGLDAASVAPVKQTDSALAPVTASAPAARAGSATSGPPESLTASSVHAP